MKPGILTAFLFRSLIIAFVSSSRLSAGKNLQRMKEAA
jgi:hypothetical protein